MRNANFEFIRERLPELHKVAVHAEIALEDNPMIALSHLKQTGRWLVRNILDQEQIPSGDREPLTELEALIRNEIVPESFIATLKQLEYMDMRESELLVDPSSVNGLFLQLFDGIGWYYKTYIDDSCLLRPLYVRSPGSGMQLAPLSPAPPKLASHIEMDGFRKQGSWQAPIENEITIELPGNEHYSGQLFQGMKHGQGTYRWNDGTRYSGQWSRDVEHGSGEKLFANGDAYRGEWKEGLFHGYGVYEWQDGARFEGHWADNLEHGFGVKTSADGTIMKGFWTYGEFVFLENQLNDSSATRKSLQSP